MPLQAGSIWFILVVFGVPIWVYRALDHSGTGWVTLLMDRKLSYDEVAALSPAEVAVRQIRDWIRSGSLPAGKSLPSERTLADRLKVSRSALRAAMQVLTAEGLVQTSPRRARVVSPLATTPRSTLLSNTIAVLTMKGFGESDRRTNRPAWATTLYHSMMETIMQAGYGSLFFTEDQLGEDGLSRMTSDLPRGLIVAHDPAGLATKQSLLEALHLGDVPVVAWGDAREWKDCDTIVSDHESGSYELTRHLISQGCRRLLRCRPVLDPKPDWLRQRDAGFERAVVEAGLVVLPPLEVPQLEESEARESVFTLMTHLLAGHLFHHLWGAEPADAILALSDSYVAEIVRACRILKRDPAAGVVIAGYDNCWRDCVETAWESLPPRVTVDKNDSQMGRMAAEMLLDRLGRRLPTAPQRRIVPHRLVISEPSPRSSVRWKP